MGTIQQVSNEARKKPGEFDNKTQIYQSELFQGRQLFPAGRVSVEPERAAEDGGPGRAEGGPGR